MLIAKIYFQVTDYHRATRFLGWGYKKSSSGKSDELEYSISQEL